MHYPCQQRSGHPTSRLERHARFSPHPTLHFARIPACEAGCTSQALALLISPAGWRGNGVPLELPWEGDAGEESTQGANAVQPFRATLGEGQVQSSPAEEGLSQAASPAPLLDAPKTSWRGSGDEKNSKCRLYVTALVPTSRLALVSCWRQVMKCLFHGTA